MHKNKLAAALANIPVRIALSILQSGKAFGTHRIEVAVLLLQCIRSVAYCSKNYSGDLV